MITVLGIALQFYISPLASTTIHLVGYLRSDQKESHKALNITGIYVIFGLKLPYCRNFMNSTQVKDKSGIY